MDGIQNYLPRDIIEGILSRLPVKSLLRFKCVCKQWSGTISAPKFAQNHLRLSKNSSSTILLEDLENSPEKVLLVDLETDEFRHSAVDYPVEVSGEAVLCHCDGLYVLWCSDCDFALWNPSRRSSKSLNRKYRFNFIDFDYLICGICYDPLVEDYKVVIGDGKHYAVFYCRKNCWSDLKELNLNPTPFYDTGGLHLNGSIFWGHGHEIVYFDGRDEKMKRLTQGGARLLGRMISSGEGMHFFPRKWNEQWVEVAAVPAAMLCDGDYVPLCWTRDGNKILIYCYKDEGGRFIHIYDVSKKSLARVEYPWKFLILQDYVRFFPHVENLFWD